VTCVGYKYSIEWGNPYTEPPNGIRLQAEMFETLQQRSIRMKTGDSAVPKCFASKHVLGDGYFVSLQPISLPAHRLSQSGISKLRKSRAKNRFEKKYPLFADQFLAEELNRRPDYYAGFNPVDLEIARNEAIQSEILLYLRFLESTTATQVTPVTLSDTGS
jgi:hypothetical protein